jgi:hypothetical protein
MTFARGRGLLALSKQEVCLPPPAGCRKSGGLPLALSITGTPQAPEGCGLNSIEPAARDSISDSKPEMYVRLSADVLRDCSIN